MNNFTNKKDFPKITQSLQMKSYLFKIAEPTFHMRSKRFSLGN